MRVLAAPQLSESATATGFGRSAWGQGQGEVGQGQSHHTGWEKQQFQFLGVAAPGWWELKGRVIDHAYCHIIIKKKKLVLEKNFSTL